jgi:ketosteroid isomerase-like protein
MLNGRDNENEISQSPCGQNILCQCLRRCNCICHARDAKAEAEIAKIERIFINALSGQDMVPYLDPNSTLIWDVAPPEDNGVEGVRQHIDNILAHSTFQNFTLTLVKMQVMASSDVGFINSLQHLTQ